ncbi:MAG: HIT domain-containing protein [Lentisphaerae bacterium]|nr:HIT domain-containing protein [Lentisphaerota bacterium]
MHRMWAPWRMDYILKSREPGCFLCDILQADEDQTNLVLQRGEHCAVLMNRYPYNNGHLMVTPYRHVDALESMQSDEHLDMMQLAARACERLRRVINPDGFNIGINQGAAAGAGLREHIHLHIVPRWNGDTNFMPVLAEVKVIPQSLQELWEQLNQVSSEA